MLHASRTLAVLVVVVLLTTVFSCTPPKTEIRLGCDNQKFVTSGSADDADATNGPGGTYTDPTRTKTDAGTTAKSDPKTCRQLAGEVVAAPGAKAAAGSNAAASATNKATSTFTVSAGGSYQYNLTTTISAALNRGSGKVQVVVRILDEKNKLVPGSDFEVVFQIKDKGNNKIGITAGNEAEVVLDNPTKGWLDNDRVGPAKAFGLNGGKYTLQFEVNFEALAPTDGKAVITGNSAVDLK